MLETSRGRETKWWWFWTWGEFEQQANAPRVKPSRTSWSSRKLRSKLGPPLSQSNRDRAKSLSLPTARSQSPSNNDDGMFYSSFLPIHFLLALTPLSLLFSFSSASEYHEQLFLRPLPPASLLASFNFRSNTSLTSFDQQNFRFFPRSLGQILQHTSTQELHLRFSTGRWDAENWGPRPWNGTKEGGSGVELWAWIEAEDEVTAFTKWISLTNSLSGLFCASLNFIDSTRTSRPVITFPPAGATTQVVANMHLLHGTLPGEVVCTENLTPFLKLLPCKGKAGISSLLDGHKLFDASWQTMSVDVKPLCSEDTLDCGIQIEQTIDMVLDIDRSMRPRDNPIPRPVPAEELRCDLSKPYSSGDACYPTDLSLEKNWSISNVFGRPIRGACPLSDLQQPGSEPICLEATDDRHVIFSEHAVERKYAGETIRCYTLGDADFDIGIASSSTPSTKARVSPLLHVERSVTGHGQERGGIQTILQNPSETKVVDFVYFETLPWFMRPYIHTLKTSLSGTPGAKFSRNLIQETFYRPAIDRARGTQLELLMTIPPQSTITLTYDFEKAILRYTEYPPDANRGFNVAPAVIRIFPEANNSDSQSQSIYLRTTSLLLPLPTPDFSMPYNVIILTSTVMALAFGNIFNLLVRRFVAADEVEGFDLQAWKRRVRGKLQSLREKVKGKESKIE